ncbi:MAG: RDD family protein [Verrucomicrobia bacterium]|nr:RDD family protein [Verrucomicrobiota bacterium]
MDEEEESLVPWIDTRIELGRESVSIPDDLRENPISRSVGGLQERAFGPVIAGCGRRLLAKAIDGLLIGLLFFAGTVWGAARFEGGHQALWVLFMVTIGLLGGWALWVLYHALTRGGTIGKRFLDLEVVDERGQPIGLGRSIGRVLAETVSVVTLGLGYLWAVIDPHKRSLHDHLCGTRVVRRRSNPARL